eukprot:1161350-Pelagomonas_calceolata.AAC.3
MGPSQEKRHLCSLRRFQGVKSTAKIWPVLRKCGQEPLQFQCFRATVKFFNSVLNSNSETLRQVLKADLHLADRNGSCWSAHVSKAFSGVRNVDVFQQKMLSAYKITMQDLRYRQQKVWREADALSPREVNRKDLNKGVVRHLPDAGFIPFLARKEKKSYVGFGYRHLVLLQLSCPCRQEQLCNPILSFQMASFNPQLNHQDQARGVRRSSNAVKAWYPSDQAPGARARKLSFSKVHMSRSTTPYLSILGIIFQAQTACLQACRHHRARAADFTEEASRHHMNHASAISYREPCSHHLPCLYIALKGFYQHNQFRNQTAHAQPGIVLILLVPALHFCASATVSNDLSSKGGHSTRGTPHQCSHPFSQERPQQVTTLNAFHLCLTREH